MEGAKKAGIHIGVYFFSQAKTVKEAEQEAAYTLKQIKNNGYSTWVDLPVVIDMENVDGSGRMLDAKNSMAKQTKITIAFLDAVKAAGFQGMVYSGSNCLVSNINGDTTYEAGYPIWLARYNSYAFTGGSGFYKNTKAVSIWQCSSTAKVNGVYNSLGGAMECDLDFWYRPNGSPDEPLSGEAKEQEAEEEEVIEAPGKVTGVKETKSKASSVQVSWNKSEDVNGYQVLVSTSRNGSFKAYDVAADRTSYTISGLAVSTEYNVKVRAYRTGKDVSKRVYGKDSSIVRVSTTKEQGFYLQTTETMNMRKYAGTDYKVLASVKEGKVVKFIRWTRASNGKVWAKVSYKGKTGYISKVGLKNCVGKVKNLGAKDVKKKNKTIKAAAAFAVTKNQGKVTYKKKSGDAKITIAANGTVTVKKGLKKGKYKFVVNVTAAGDANYNKITKAATVNITVK
jgi:uncharacterized protein YgiM (DUF1202 family)